jgi:DNA-binding transcriptional LysR family regulator
MQETFRGRLKQLKIAMEIKSTETIKQAVIAGMGVSFLSAHTIGLELETRRLVVLDVEGFPAMLHWYLVHRKDKRLPPVALAFKQFLLAEGAALIDKITRKKG